MLLSVVKQCWPLQTSLVVCGEAMLWEYSRQHKRNMACRLTVASRIHGVALVSWR